MNNNLRWWHAACKEVRQIGAEVGRNNRWAEANKEPERVTPVETMDGDIERVMAKWGRTSDTNVWRGISPKALAFLRTAWLAAYKKARATAA
jgi:hypothetical protein